MARDKFSSRLGFILISAGCAIGLGNVWRFPYITGEYGGAAFVMLYILFLVILGIPILVMEFAVGRASQRSIARAFNELEPPGTKWHIFKWVGFGGNYLLMMFYTIVAGWMVAYVPKMISGELNGATAETTAAAFNNMLANPFENIFWMLLVCVVCFLICSLGVNRGVERITKVMMLALLAVMVALVIFSLTLPHAGEGIAFFLIPNFDHLFSSWEFFLEAVYAAMGQAFFSLSIGMGSMAIFASYMDKKNALPGEAATIAVLNLGVGIAAGLIIFPACFAFGITPSSGPGLVFVTLPAVFEQMWMGQFWGALFFVFMSFAALSTVIAVFEGIICYCIDEWGWTRKKAVIVNMIAICILATPCALGFNVLSGVQIPGIGDIQSIEDFIVSSNIMPIGSLVFVMFCVSKRGWGWKNFLTEANTGQGRKFPTWLYKWMRYGVPVLVILILVAGWVPIVMQWFA